jgi:hypothetical protein
VVRRLVHPRPVVRAPALPVREHLVVRVPVHRVVVAAVARRCR